MDAGDPQVWQQGAGAFKTAIDAIGSVYELVKKLRSSGGAPSDAEQQAVDGALAQAGVAAKVAEAQIAKALGYQLCHCQFPPTAMLTVGQRNSRTSTVVQPIFECSACGFNTGGMYAYQRIAPPRL
ncbi:MAG: hypothetical protein WAM62_07700 [Pseudolabrys sp.]